MGDMSASPPNECSVEHAQTSAPTALIRRIESRPALRTDPILLPQKRSILRHSTWDALFVALAVAHAIALTIVPSAPIIALGLWWNANTIAHNFIHRPFFRSNTLNDAFSAFESLILGIPHRLWRDRHLAHHAGQPGRWHWSRQLAAEVCLLCALWCGLLAFTPGFLLTVYLPGWLLGLGLCQLQGFFEHRQGTTSHYGRLYNLLFFNDGYHAEHHARPVEHWARLPLRKLAGTRTSRWPAVLRWLEIFDLNNLERLVLCSPTLQRFVIRQHERAVRTLLPALEGVRHAGIVGGGMFPRTALILQQLLPGARLTIIDASEENLRSARPFVGRAVKFIHAFHDTLPLTEVDLLVIPLAFIGERSTIYHRPPAPLVLVHDWLWRPRGESVVVSLFLLKRLNLIRK